MPGNPNCTCVSCTLAFGQQLANIFHTWTELSSQFEKTMAHINYSIETSNSALRQLQPFLGGKGACDGAATAPSGGSQVFSQAGWEEIEALGIKCSLIFKTMILLVQRASERQASEDSESDSDSDDGSDKDEEEDKSDILIGPVPDLYSPKTLGLISKIRGQRKWCEARFKRCHNQLKWVNKGLFVQVHMAKLAQLNNGTTQRQNGAFESEVTIRSALFYTRGAQLRLTKKGAEKQKKNQRRRERLAKKREKEEKEDDNASTTSSHTSGETVVGETPTVNHPPGTVESPPSGIAEITQVQDGVSGKGEPGNNSVESPKKLNVAMPVQDTKPDKNVKKNSPKKVSFTLSQMSQNLSDIMEEWTHRIFGRYDEFTRDWPSDELEAWVTRGRPYSVPIKVPFGHRRLQAGLKNINAVGKETDLRTFGRYIVGGPRTQYIVDDVVYAANKLQSRERVCLAFRELLRDDEADSFTVVFFSIQKEKAPILLTDVLGRKTSIPFELGKEWENIKDIILDLFVSVAEIGPHILEGHYDFFNVKGEIVLPRLWTDSVKPGDSINMRLWPMELNPLRRFYPQHPPFPFTSNKAESNNKEMERRAARLHNCIIGISPGPPGRAPHPARVGYSGEYPRGPRPAIRPPPPPAPVNMGRPPAMMPPPPMRPSMPPPPMRPSIPLRRTKPFRWQRNQLDGMSLAEDKELSFIDYVSEAEKAKRVTIADLLTKFTFLTDVVGDKCLDEWSCDFSGSDSDSDSGTDSDYDSDSSSSSSGTHSIVDD